MAILRFKRTYFAEAVQNPFCGDEMNPYVAPLAGETHERSSLEPSQPTGDQSGTGPLAGKRRLWARLASLLSRR